MIQALDEAKASAAEYATAATEALAQAEAAKEKAAKDVGGREIKLKKALADMKHKVDSAVADKTRAELMAAEARSQLDSLCAISPCCLDYMPMIQS